MIFINPHKCCTFVTEKSCLTSNANLCIIQKLKLLPSHYLYWGETLVNRSFLAIRNIWAEFWWKIKEKLNVCCVYRGKCVCCGKKFARHICIVECMPGNGVWCLFAGRECRFCSAGRMLFFSRKYQKHDGCRVVYGKRKRLAHGMCKNMGGNAVFFNDYYYLCNR